MTRPGLPAVIVTRPEDGRPLRPVEYRCPTCRGVLVGPVTESVCICEREDNDPPRLVFGRQRG